MTAEGLIVRTSGRNAKETANRLAAAVTARGMTVMARIDHAAAAVKVGMELRPTELLIFGNAKAGTPLMQDGQTVGIDLPLKALVFEDEAGQTRIAYNEPGWLAARHGIVGADHAISTMCARLAEIIEAATQ